MNVADPGEQVVFNLKVQTAEEPGHKAVAAGKIYRGLHLMNRPGVLDASRVFLRQRVTRVAQLVPCSVS